MLSRQGCPQGVAYSIFISPRPDIFVSNKFFQKKFADTKNISTFVVPNRGVEQLVARRAHNPEAGGSSPSPATKQDTSFEVSLFFMSIPSIDRTARGIIAKNGKADFSEKRVHIFGSSDPIFIVPQNVLGLKLTYFRILMYYPGTIVILKIIITFAISL